MTSDSGDIELSLSIKIKEDKSWELTVFDTLVSSSCRAFSMLPQTIGSVAELKTVLLHVDTLTICLGNNDTKYEGLITMRRGNFMDHSGMVDITMFFALLLL